MKTIGLIGGMSWESTREYYRVINQRVAARLGGLHSARCLLYSFDFHDLDALQRRNDWAEAARLMVAAAAALQRAGADLLVICANTMHKVAPQVEAAVPLPLVHIADATAQRVRAAGLRRVGLLGTRFTMDEPFIRGRLAERHGLDVRVPQPDLRGRVDALIFDDLCRGRFTGPPQRTLQEAVAQLAADGCGGVILGCTELGLALQPADSPLPLFDTAIIHAEVAADLALD